jgi:AcrR family transcriptional regulator
MGYREDLLAGAKRCLIEIGYGRTTARDIVAASGANLASIGYHYGSKEALLNAALLDALSDSGEEFRRAVENAKFDEAASPIERFEEVWGRIIENYTSRRHLWLASFEVFAQIDRVPDLKEAVADGLEEARGAMSQLFLQLLNEADRDLDDETLRALGSYFQALITGVMAQCLVDPERAPSAHDLVLALRAIFLLADGGKPVTRQRQPRRSRVTLAP